MTSDFSPSKARLMGLTLYLFSFCEGFLTAQNLVIFFFYSSTCKMTLKDFNKLDFATAFIPLINPLYGFVADRFALFGCHKKSYLFVVASLTTLGYGYMATLNRGDYNFWFFVALSFYIEILSQFRTVLINAYCLMASQYNVEAEKREAGQIGKRLIAIRQNCLHMGRLLAMPLMEFYDLFDGYFFIFLAFITLLIACAALLTEEVHQPARREEKRLLAGMMQSFQVIRKERMHWMLMASFIIQCSPFLEGMVKYYLNGDLNFSKNQFIIRSALSRFSMMFGVYSLQTFFKSANRSRFTKISSTLYALMVGIFYFTLIFSPHLGSLAVWLVMLFAIAHSYTSELKKVSFISIFVEKSPPQNQSFFSAIMFYLDNAAMIVSKYASKRLMDELKITETNFARGHIYILVHILVGLAGNMFLALSPIPVKPRAQTAQPPKEDAPAVIVAPPAAELAADEEANKMHYFLSPAGTDDEGMADNLVISTLHDRGDAPRSS